MTPGAAILSQHRASESKREEIDEETVMRYNGIEEIEPGTLH